MAIHLTTILVHKTIEIFYDSINIKGAKYGSIGKIKKD